MTAQDLNRLDDTAVLMQRQEAADKGDYPRKLKLDAEVIRRWGQLRSLLNRRPGKPAAGTGVLVTNSGAYRAFGSGAYRDDESFRVKPGESWLAPRRRTGKEDRYVEYGIAREEG